jgi:hypothetical protein
MKFLPQINYLSKEFIKHIENTSNVCVYKLGNHKLPNNLFFYKASTITLINCSKEGVSNIINPSYFPNLRRINYMSLHPGDTTISERFKTSVEWIFPNSNYKFYRDMISYKYGYIDNTLWSKYIQSFELNESFSEFDFSIDSILYIPDYGTISGEWYKKQFYNYLIYKYQQDSEFKDNTVKNTILLEELEDSHLHKEYMLKSLEYYNSD